YEHTVSSSETMVYLASVRRMLRLATRQDAYNSLPDPIACAKEPRQNNMTDAYSHNTMFPGIADEKISQLILTSRLRFINDSNRDGEMNHARS
ncbi:MAG: hypothetical protein M1546_03755, partial [Chloroflexi bacterium]|nr:hypothetical protein [Chloroflexota bacterium]